MNVLLLLYKYFKILSISIFYVRYVTRGPNRKLHIKYCWQQFMREIFNLKVTARCIQLDIHHHYHCCHDNSGLVFTCLIIFFYLALLGNINFTQIVCCLVHAVRFPTQLLFYESFSDLSVNGVGIPFSISVAYLSRFALIITYSR